jgi:hypothetical protein
MKRIKQRKTYDKFDKSHLQKSIGVVRVEKVKIFNNKSKLYMTDDNRTNLTLFDQNLTAVPIQLKNMTRTINPLHQHPTPSELQKAKASGYPYRFVNGVAFKSIIKNPDPNEDSPLYKIANTKLSNDEFDF